jgi:methyl-accepting chemotaxis protein
MIWFYNLRTATKLMIGYALLAVVVAGTGWLALGNLDATNQMMGTLHRQHLTGLSKISEAHVWQLHAARAVRSAVLAGTREEAERFGAEIEKDFQGLAAALKEVEPTVIRAEGKALIETIRGILPEWEGQIRATARLNLEGKRVEALEQMKAARVNGNKLQVAFEGLTEQKLRVGDETYKESQAIYSRSRTQMIALCVIGIVAAVGLGLWIGRLIGGPLSRAVKVLEAVAGRDFTQRLEVDSRDEVGQMATALNQAVAGVQRALTEVRDVADSVATAAQQLSSSAEDIAGGAQEQASSLEETAANLEEITATVKQNAENAQQASQLGAGARETAEKGGAVVGDAVGAMGEINKASKRIADIITTIDEIAFQTNLLALNAAVEAARAGEQGRGFAVVAAEVRNLAQRSATAAREIKSLIQDSVRKVEGGTALVNQSGTRLQEIVQSVKRVTDLVAEMASASREQSSGIDQVNKAVSQMDQVTQANSAQTEELSSTAETMNQQADQLRKLVAQFRLGDDATSRAAEPARSREVTAARRRPPVARTREAAPKTATASRPANGHANGHSQELDAAMLAALTADADTMGGKRGEFEEV